MKPAATSGSNKQKGVARNEANGSFETRDVRLFAADRPPRTRSKVQVDSRGERPKTVDDFIRKQKIRWWTASGLRRASGPPVCRLLKPPAIVDDRWCCGSREGSRRAGGRTDGGLVYDVNNGERSQDSRPCKRGPLNRSLKPNPDRPAGSKRAEGSGRAGTFHVQISPPARRFTFTSAELWEFTGASRRFVRLQTLADLHS